MGGAEIMGMFSFAPPRDLRAPRRFNLNVQVEGAILWKVLSGGARNHKESCRFSADQEESLFFPRRQRLRRYADAGANVGVGEAEV
jgi:hypothetical protein